MVPWWNDGKVKEFVSHGTRNPDEIQIFTHGFVWTRNSKQKLLWLKGFNLLAQTRRKSLIESLVIKDCVKSQNTKTLETSDSPKHQHTPFNFILVTLPNKIGHFCHLGNDFFSLAMISSYLLIQISPWKSDRVNRWGYVQRNLSFLPRQRLDFKVILIWVPRGLTVCPLKNGWLKDEPFLYGAFGVTFEEWAKKNLGGYTQM